LTWLTKKLNITEYPDCGGVMVFCPECETDLDIEEDEVDEGEVVSCPECGSDFEVITANPIELKPVDEEEYEEDEDEVKAEKDADDGDDS
jgi:alpha-aminoadipate carrier protein LysW